ncbi:hypothetical protein [Aurantiacibacter hainanensis]|uniref:hypothetical protein n=1 Tax=Aurantiacibacter hainanensis TaxID=3076114 RepID=UPI0030C72418
MPKIAGKTIAQRQLLFAREAGCEKVIAHGNGARPEAIDLRHAAEGAGMKFQIVSSSHALSGIIADDDSLLVLQPGLLPESRSALDLLRAEGDRVLVVSAGPGANAGFERIDLDRAWAGVLSLPGQWLADLASLPDDAAPHAALLRIALQHRLPEARLADKVLDEGRWYIVSSHEAARKRAVDWQRLHLGDVSEGRVSRWLGRAAVIGLGTRIGDTARARTALLAVAGLLMGIGVALGFYERPILGFALVALGVPVLEAFLALSRLAVAPFGRIKRLPWIRWVADAALLALGIMAIDSLLYRSIYPPLVLASSLLLLDRRNLPAWLEPLRDRMLIAIFVAVVAAVATPEIALMLAGLLVLAANIAVPRS